MISKDFSTLARLRLLPKRGKLQGILEKPGQAGGPLKLFLLARKRRHATQWDCERDVATAIECICASSYYRGVMIATIGRVAGILLLATSALCQTIDQNSLQCEIPAALPGEEHAVFPMSAEETARLRNAPHGARRLSEHQLQVRWAAGTRIFKDKPPYEPLEGVSWTYCGYNASFKLHLIRKADNSLFTGVLLDDNTGLMLPGGLAILFSPDHSLYLAYEQPDGQDGETLKLYKRNGVLLWKGYDFIGSPDGKSVIVDAENMRNMRWDSQNRPQATLYLKGGRTMIVTLMRDDKGKLD